MLKPEQFNSISAAYDKCRERNRPMIVDVPDEDSGTDRRITLKIFPSGGYLPVTDRALILELVNAGSTKNS